MTPPADTTRSPAAPSTAALAAAEAQIGRILAEHDALSQALRIEFPRIVARAADVVLRCYQAGGKVLLFGNGGSFSDALHMEGEFTNRFHRDHEGLPAICLGAGQATLTSTANDYSYQDLFARLVKAYGKPGDVAIGFTTSGNSENVVRGFVRARELGLATIAMTGRTGGKCRDLADVLVNVPSDHTPRIQEFHIVAAHSICELVEDALFPPRA